MQKGLNNLYKLLGKNKTVVYLLFITLLGLYVRIFNLNWDNSFYFHPDERAIYMFTTPLSYPESLKSFLSSESPLNPRFFAYGNLPIYLLKFVSDIASLANPILSQYGGIHFVGRLINALAGTSTILLIFFFSKRLFDKNVALLSALFYSIAVFPIQNSNFYTVDTLLTFFILLTLFFLDVYIKKPILLNLFLVAISFGLALSSKISALPIILIILFGFIVVFFRKKNKRSIVFIFSQVNFLLIFLLTVVVTFFITQPYTLIDFANFYEQISFQSKMGTDPFIFPYTLQYVGKIPVLFEMKNIVLWGMGIPLSLFALGGLFYTTYKAFRKPFKNIRIFLLVLFFWLYFILSSSYAVGWMRYLLPIYPALVIFSGVFCVNILFPNFKKYFIKKDHKILEKLFFAIFIFICSLWTISFMTIYSKPNPRIVASDWIHKNIAPGKTLAIEHWDDGLPVYGANEYKIISLPLYDPDTGLKWENINRDLETTDYIIIASNRLYAPLQKLTDCSILPQGRCYALTAKYYNNLFSGNLNFKKVAEFNSYPTIPIINLRIYDQNADESFTVIDHPKILIFERIN